jgi:two-component system phosphate regulon response regulator PhoB
MSEKPTILVVDDDAPILALMRNVLREFGFDAVTAISGEQALVAARSRRPSLVLVDKNMPGMRGEEVVRALRAEPGLSHLPVLILSGEPMSSAEIRSIQADGAVTKPFDIMALIGEIRRHLDGGA